jgi:alkanesulfonate monooxygenase SsuD/methylene tetrahydromethanopterin reductase-like flavin-dependent oxidoreductase (luciferase family)
MPDGGAPDDVYQTYRANGGAGGRVATNRSVYVCEDPEQGWSEIKKHVLYVFNVYREWFAEAGDFPELGEPLTDPEPLKEHFLLGTPETVRKSLEELQQRLSLDLLVFWARPPGLPIEKSTHSLELFANEVMPHFR